MKEATGELNMTVVTIVAIAALVAFFYLIIWPSIQQGMALTSACSTAGNTSMTFHDDDGAESIKCEHNSGVTTCEDLASGTTKVCD